jgi:type IV secretion system protein VirD4
MDKEKLAAFAQDKELKALSWTPESFYLGRALPETTGGAFFDVGVDDDRAVLIVAGSRSGKGAGILINNLIGWPGGAFCIDPKGELASITAMRRGKKSAAKGSGTTVREFLGQNVAALDPFGEVKGPAKLYRKTYNPLDDISPSSPSFFNDIDSVASAIIVPETGANSYFSDMARVLLAGALEAGLVTGRACSLSDISSLALGPWDEFASVLEASPGAHSEPALGAVNKFGDSREGNAVYTTLSRNLSWLNNPAMRNYLKGSSFSLVSAVQNDETVYTVLPVETMEQQKRWLRLMLAMAFRAKVRQSVYGNKRHMLFVVDEMYQLGTMKELEGGISYLPGFGVKLVSVVQNLGQLKQLYKDNWQTFIGNSGAVIGFGLMDQEGPEYISKRIGQHHVERISKSRSQTKNKPVWKGKKTVLRNPKADDHESRAGSSTSTSENIQQQIEIVLRPEEISYHTNRDKARLVALMASGKPLFLERFDYFRRFSPKWFEDLDNIRKIESYRR